MTFVDLVGDRLLRWDQTAGVSVVRENTGEGNGCTFDRQGRLLMCEGADHRRVTRMDADGTVTAVAERCDGKRFHKPNDVVCRSDGSVYFTDPSLPRIHRRRGSGQRPEAARRCSCASGIMVL